MFVNKDVRPLSSIQGHAVISINAFVLVQCLKNICKQ